MTTKENTAQAGQQGGESQGNAEQLDYSPLTGNWQLGLKDARFSYRKHGDYHTLATDRQQRQAIKAELKRTAKKAKRKAGGV